jgi:hypothetical protein
MEEVDLIFAQFIKGSLVQVSTNYVATTVFYIFIKLYNSMKL